MGSKKQLPACPELRDDETYEERKEQEEREKAQLAKVSEKWEAVAEFVEQD